MRTLPAAAQRSAALWRFGPKAFKTYYDLPSPVKIEQLADQQVPISKVLSSWVVSPEPQAHIGKIKELFDSGASIVNIHAPQADQQKVIDFYARDVLPHFRQALAEARSFAEQH